MGFKFPDLIGDISHFVQGAEHNIGSVVQGAENSVGNFFNQQVHPTLPSAPVNPQNGWEGAGNFLGNIGNSLFATGELPAMGANWLGSQLFGNDQQKKTANGLIKSSWDNSMPGAWLHGAGSLVQQGAMGAGDSLSGPNQVAVNNANAYIQSQIAAGKISKNDGEAMINRNQARADNNTANVNAIGQAGGLNMNTAPQGVPYTANPGPSANYNPSQGVVDTLQTFGGLAGFNSGITAGLLRGAGEEAPAVAFNPATEMNTAGIDQAAHEASMGMGNGTYVIPGEKGPVQIPIQDRSTLTPNHPLPDVTDPTQFTYQGPPEPRPGVRQIPVTDEGQPVNIPVKNLDARLSDIRDELSKLPSEDDVQTMQLNAKQTYANRVKQAIQNFARTNFATGVQRAADGNHPGVTAQLQQIKAAYDSHVQGIQNILDYRQQLADEADAIKTHPSYQQAHPPGPVSDIRVHDPTVNSQERFTYDKQGNRVTESQLVKQYNDLKQVQPGDRTPAQHAQLQEIKAQMKQLGSPHPDNPFSSTGRAMTDTLGELRMKLSRVKDPVREAELRAEYKAKTGEDYVKGSTTKKSVTIKKTAEDKAVEEIARKQAADESAKKNPVNGEYDKQYKASPPKTVRHIHELVKGAQEMFQKFRDNLSLQARRLSDSDMKLLDKRRGQSIDEFMQKHGQEIDNPKAVEKYLQSVKIAQDELHEYGRAHDEDMGNYLEHRGAGLFTVAKDAKDAEPVDHSVYAKTKFGTSKNRTYTNYDDLLAENSDRVRKNANFHEDVMQDLNKASVLKVNQTAKLMNDSFGEGSANLKVTKGDAKKQLNNNDDVYTTPDIAKKWNGMNKVDDSTGLGKGVKVVNQKVQSGVVQTTVYNAFIHVGNIMTQAWHGAGTVSKVGVRGALLTVKAGKELADPLVRMQTQRDYYRAGGHIDFSNREAGWIRKATGDTKFRGLSDANKTVLYHVDAESRLAMFKAAVDNGMDPREAVKKIDDFLGDSKEFGWAGHFFGFFLKWFYTVGKSLYKTGEYAVHGETGALQNTMLSVAAVYGLSYLWGHVINGNDNGSVRAPGSVGIIKEVVNGAIGLFHGDNGKAMSQVVTNRVNPLIKEAGQQIFDKDLYTGKTIPNDQRLQHAGDTILNPMNQVDQVATGSRSPAEQLLALTTGLRLPHAPGEAATNNKALSLLNTPKAKQDGGEAYKQEQQSIAAGNNAKDSLNTTDQEKQLSRLLALETSDKDPKTGKTIMSGPNDTIVKWGTLSHDGKLLAAYQNQMKQTDGHDPIYDRSTPELSIIAQYKAQAPGEPGRTALEENNPWLYQAINEESKWANQQVISGNVKKPDDYVPYPTLSDQQVQLLTDASTLDHVQNPTAQQKADLSNLYSNPVLQQAYQALDDHTNAVRDKLHLPQIQFPPSLTPDEQAAFSHYQSLPSGGGVKSGWINANKDVYNSIQAKLAQSTLFNIEKKGAVAYEGGDNSNLQALLKDVVNAGKYDIATVTNADGSKSYNLVGTNGMTSTGAYDAGLTGLGNSSKSGYFKKSSGSSGGGSATNRAIARGMDSGKYAVKVNQLARKGHVRRPSTLPRARVRVKHISKVTINSGVPKIHKPRISLKNA